MAFYSETASPCKITLLYCCGFSEVLDAAAEEKYWEPVEAEKAEFIGMYLKSPSYKIMRFY